MKRIKWINDNPRLISHVGYTLNRCVLVVLTMNLSPSIVLPALVAIGLGINTGLRKGHSGWVLTLVQTGLLWPIFYVFKVKNPVSLQLQDSGFPTMALLTFSAGLLGVLIKLFQEKEREVA